MWGEGELKSWWTENANEFDFTSVNDKKNILVNLQTYLDDLKKQEKKYTNPGLFKPTYRKQNRIISNETDKTIHGMCPVASEKTICCNLHTIDAVENCVFGCSYCTIQTFYGKDILIFIILGLVNPPIHLPGETGMIFWMLIVILPPKILIF
jgi:spore photoproduct lyase